MEKIGRNETELAILELRKAVKDLVDENPKIANDLYLLSWLKGRDMDVKQTEKLMRQALKWRRTELPKILSSPIDPQVAETFAKVAPKSFCRDGKIIEFVIGDQPELPKVLKEYGQAPILRIVMEEIIAAEEKVLAWSQKILDESENKEIFPDSYHGYIQVFNANNVSLKLVTSLRCIQFLRNLAHLTSNYCPFGIFKCIIINAPKFGVYLYNFFKPILETKYTTSEFYDDNEDIWKKILLKYVHSDLLPNDYGGNLKISEQSMYKFQDIPLP